MTTDELYEALEASPKFLSEIVARLARLEASEKQVSQLRAQVEQLQARVTQLEKGVVTMEDKNVVPGTTLPPTLYAARNGDTSVLAARLGHGADPNNQDDGHGGTCLVASACYAKAECTRLLIEHGANVNYAYSGDNASILFMLALVFQDRPVGMYRPGDYVLTADLLVEAGAPTDMTNIEGECALDLLRSMEVEEDSQHGRERQGLIAVIEGSYWQGCNPFLLASADKAALLLLDGQANNGDGHVDMTRVRSINPSLRQSVLDMLFKYQGMRQTFVDILLTMKGMDSVSPFCILCGHEASILPSIAAFAGARGWSPQTLKEAIAVLQQAIAHYETDQLPRDDGSDDDDDDNADDNMDAADY